MARGTRPSPRKDRETVDVRSAGGVIFDDRGQVLLLRRVGEGTWCFPKGHIESGESPQAAAAREIREECGLEVEIGRRVAEIGYTFYFPPENVNHDKRVVYFLANPIGGVVTLEDRFDGSQWVPPGQALGMLPYRNDKTVLRAALKVRKATRRS